MRPLIIFINLNNFYLYEFKRLIELPIYYKKGMDIAKSRIEYLYEFLDI